MSFQIEVVDGYPYRMADGELPIETFADDTLPMFDVAPTPVGLHDRFVMPPFSTLDRRSGIWQGRRRRWLALGIQSEVGRGAGLVFGGATETDGDLLQRMNAINGGTSVFDPVLCELVYRWFSRPGARVLDPFAGGSVRGVVASTLAREYVGVDIRQAQLAANHAQANICGRPLPTWQEGDATDLDATLSPFDPGFDLVFSCPPYADLEVYSDDPRDISRWPYDEFLRGHAAAIAGACAYLKPDRYAAWVVGDVRDPAGRYRGLHHETVQAFKAAGLHVLNECVIVDPVGTAAARSARPMLANRKITLTHQHLLIFVKGDVRAAADWVGEEEPCP